jgi:hypothetical protein
MQELQTYFVIALSQIADNTYLEVSVVVVLAEAPSGSTSVLSIIRKVSAISFSFSFNLLREKHGEKLQNQYFCCLGKDEEHGRAYMMRIQAKCSSGHFVYPDCFCAHMGEINAQGHKPFQA